MTARNPNRAVTVYEGADGYWHGRVTVGLLDDGSPDRRHVLSKSNGVVVGKVRELERDWDIGQVKRPGQRWTVAAWLEHWIREHRTAGSTDGELSGLPERGKHPTGRLRPTSANVRKRGQE